MESHVFDGKFDSELYLKEDIDEDLVGGVKTGRRILTMPMLLRIARRKDSGRSRGK